MSHQIFSEEATPLASSGSSNVCLHYGNARGQHLSQGGLKTGEYRMVYRRWDPDYHATLMVRLKLDYTSHVHHVAPAGSPLPDCLSFGLFPNFPRSVISDGVAAHFKLQTQATAFGGVYPLPLARLLGGANVVGIGGVREAWARIDIESGADVDPPPARGRVLSFLVSSTVPQDFAILGRDFARGSLVLYRGIIEKAYLPPKPGRVYIGADT